MSVQVLINPEDFEIIIQETRTDLDLFTIKCWEANIITDKERKSLVLVNIENYGINRRFYNIMRKKSVDDWVALIKLFENGKESQPEFVLTMLKVACAEARSIAEATRANLLNLTSVQSIDGKLQGIQQGIDEIIRRVQPPMPMPMPMPRKD